MVLKLEAVKARHGDCLLLHHEKGSKSSTILIDAGPSRVYRPFLRPRLVEMRRDLGLAATDPLPLDMLMVSHIDDDHVVGVNELFTELVDASSNGDPEFVTFTDVWYNSFDDIVGNNALAMSAAATRGVDMASLVACGHAGAGLRHESALIAASVANGRKLRNQLKALSYDVNYPWNMPLFSTENAAQDTFTLGSGLELLVIGPLERRVKSLQKKWDKFLKDKGLGVSPSQVEAADYLDSSVSNLASLVVLAKDGNKTCLLTGDARGDDILDSLDALSLFDSRDRFPVDILKLPHHGSDRNVETDFFRRIPAKHYVVSGDGEHHNPEIATFEMIKAARGTSGYTIWMTYGPDDLKRDYTAADRRKLKDVLRGVDVRSPRGNATSVTARA